MILPKINKQYSPQNIFSPYQVSPHSKASLWKKSYPPSSWGQDAMNDDKLQYVLDLLLFLTDKVDINWKLLIENSFPYFDQFQKGEKSCKITWN